MALTLENPVRSTATTLKTPTQTDGGLCVFLKDEGARGYMKSLKGLENGILGKVCTRAFLRKKGAFGSVTSLRCKAKFLVLRVQVT